MLFSLLCGVLAYIMAQFLWYSPLVFGPRWSRYQKSVPSKTGEPLALPTFVSPTIRTIVLPAVTVSIALHVLRVVMNDLDGSGFFIFVILLWFLVISGKYLRKSTDRVQWKKWSIEDGALLSSLLLVALVVFVWWGNER